MGRERRWRPVAICIVAGISLHLLLLEYWTFVSRHYRDKPGMPPTGMFYTMPGIEVWRLGRFHGSAGELVWALSDAVLYATILLICFGVWKEIQAGWGQK